MPLHFSSGALRVYKPCLGLLTVVMMLSRQNTWSSFGASLRALFLVEDLEKRPMAHVEVDGLQDDQKGPLIEDCVIVETLRMSWR